MFLYFYGRKFTKYLNEHDMQIYPNDFWHKIKIYTFDPYDVLLIATNTVVVRIIGTLGKYDQRRLWKL